MQVLILPAADTQANKDADDAGNAKHQGLVHAVIQLAAAD